MQFTSFTLAHRSRHICKKLNCVSNTRNPCVVSASAVSCFNVPYSQNLCQLYLYIGLKNFSMFRSYSFRYVPVHSSTCFNVLTKSMLIVFVICYGYIAPNNFSPFRSLVSSLCSLYSSTSNNNNNYQKAHAGPHKT